MKVLHNYLKLFLIPLLVFTSANLWADDAWQNASGWWNATDIPAFDKSKITQQLSLVKVQGNKFVDDEDVIKVKILLI